MFCATVGNVRCLLSNLLHALQTEHGIKFVTAAEAERIQQQQAAGQQNGAGEGASKGAAGSGVLA
jgi:hypothetical protein